MAESKHLLCFFAMSNSQLTLPHLQRLPETLLRDGSIHLALEQGVVIFRASSAVQERIAELLAKQKAKTLTAEEESELLAYEEVDDYLSHVNRLIRNLSQPSGVNLAA